MLLRQDGGRGEEGLGNARGRPARASPRGRQVGAAPGGGPRSPPGRLRRPAASPTDEAPKEWHWNEPAHQAESRSEEHTSELQSLMRISYAVFCLTKKIH